MAFHAGRATALLVAGLLLWLAGHGLGWAAPKVDPDDQMLFDLRVANLTVGSGTRAYTTPSGLCLDLGDVIDSLQLAITQGKDGSSAKGWAFDQSRVIDIERDQQIARFGDQSEKLNDTTIWDSRSGWCVLAANLGRWLGVTFNPDMANAVLKVETNGTLPIEAAQKRAANAERLHEQVDRPALATVELPYRIWRMPSFDISLNALAEGARGKGTLVGSTYDILAVGEIAWLSANARLVSDRQGAPQSLRLRLYREDGNGQLLGPLHATTVGFGDVTSGASTLATNPTAGRGLAIGNRPLGTADRFDSVDFSGVSPNGWDTELYRNGELVQSTTANGTGSYQFANIPLQIGSDDFEVVQYGPQGQIRRERRAYQIGGQTPLRGETWWSLSLVDAHHDLMMLKPLIGLTPGGWRFDMSVDHGLGSGLALGASLHDLTLPQTGTNLVAEINGSASIWGAAAYLDLAGGQQGGAAYSARLLGRVAGVSFTLEDTRNAHLASERLDPDLRAVTEFTLEKSVRMAGLLLPLHFDLRATSTVQQHILDVRTQMSLTTKKLAISGVLSLRRIQDGDGTVRSETTGELLYNGRIGPVRLRGDMQWTLSPSPRFDVASIAGNIALGERNMVNATVGHAGTGHLTYGQFDISRDCGFAAVSLDGQLDSHRGFSVGVGMRFSVDSGSGLGHISSLPSAASGRIAVRAFRDLNGDGRRSKDEPYIRAPGLIMNDMPIGSDPRIKDPTDLQMITALQPSVPVRLALDENEITDPFDVVSTPGVAVVPRAGAVTPVELGITGTITIEGTVRIGDQNAGGEQLQLITRDGSVAYHVRTDFDGFFSLERVRYGEYHLRLTRDGHVLLDKPIEARAGLTTIRLGDVAIAADK